MAKCRHLSSEVLIFHSEDSEVGDFLSSKYLQIKIKIDKYTVKLKDMHIIHINVIFSYKERKITVIWGYFFKNVGRKLKKM